ncbi:uncharacterized protein LOC110635847 isoform X2 [Hevea brasiliensis]|uniref:uncharacterized protein LOC110635847 isoform X2 n=1 Tax=Hevea brasiliensis TaxID=3981 RepID=UPI0025EF3A7D|nr:uncharacterized protein LOC110635847 isoform X2 [Hevea brasiliensis]
MEPIEIGSRDEHLYDCYTLSHIEAVPSPSEGQTSQIQRKIKWVTLNPYGEVLQHVGSNRIKEHKDGNVSLPQNHMDDVVTSHILSDFESFDFELSDLLEEDVMGIEPGLVFFEDGSYSRGPVNIQVVDVDDSKLQEETFFRITCSFPRKLWRKLLNCLGGFRLAQVLVPVRPIDWVVTQIMRVAVYEER